MVSFNLTGRSRRSYTPEYNERRGGYGDDSSSHYDRRWTNDEARANSRLRSRSRRRSRSHSRRQSSIQSDRRSRSDSRRRSRSHSGSQSSCHSDSESSSHSGHSSTRQVRSPSISVQEESPKEKLDDQDSGKKVTDKVNLEPESLDEDVLKAMGERLPKRIFATPIHKDLAERIQEVIQQGLPSDDRKTLLKKLPIPENAPFMDPPKLNLEVKACLSAKHDSILKRDNRIIEKQGLITGSLAGLSKLMTMLFKSTDVDKLVMIDVATGVYKLLADLQHEESSIRRSLIVKNIDTSWRDTLTSTSVDEYLFGKSLEEKINAAKALERTGKKLSSQTQPQSNQSSSTKNWKGPPRQSTNKRFQSKTWNGQRSTQTRRSFYPSRKPSQPKQKHETKKVE